MKMSAATISDVINKYFSNGGRAGHKDQRLGQWFYNTWDKSGKAFPELFYAEDSVAGRLIWEHYCEMDKHERGS